MKDFRSGLGLWDQIVIPSEENRRAVKGCQLFPNSSSIKKGHLLGAINRIMSAYRVQARAAPITPFHHFLHRAMDEKRIMQCLTRNFDGLETRDRPDLADQVLMLHGDNRVLTCLGANCRDITGEQVAQYDRQFAEEEEVPCPECVSTSE